MLFSWDATKLLGQGHSEETEGGAYFMDMQEAEELSYMRSEWLAGHRAKAQQSCKASCTTALSLLLLSRLCNKCHPQH